jgi:hypothetical protein
MADVITESGMDFAADNTFRIEKSPLYTRIGSGVKAVEFVRAMGDRLLFIEAKTTFANPNNFAEGNFAKFLSALDGICEKFIHSLNLYSSVEVGVANSSFPDSFNPPDKTSIALVLVIRNHEYEWCKRIETQLKRALPKYLMKIWKPDVYVMNRETAKEWQLIAG